MGGLLLSFVFEACLIPRPKMPFSRPLSALGVHVGIWLIAYGIELALFQRPIFAVVNVLALQSVIVLVSNVKYRTLREPFVYPDFEYFLDAIRHPRLYLPFFGRTKAAAAGGAYGFALWGGLALEESLTGVTGLWALSFSEWIEEDAIDFSSILVSFWILTSVIVGIGVLIVMYCRRHSDGMQVTFDASTDLKRLGLFMALFAYRREERRPIFFSPTQGRFAQNQPIGDNRALAADKSLPDIVVIQSESFFDARRVFPSIRSEVLSGFDVLKGEAIAHGPLRVAAWGANTVRTEFAMLSGLPPESLGVHRFNPYRRLARSGVSTLASYLRGLGYRTICVHPYPDSFYGRNVVFPKLGFDAFLDIRQFEGVEHFGPYVSDAAVADFVKRELTDDGRREQPLFIFVITMENHGPLHWEKVSRSDREHLFTKPPVDSCNDLVAYVRHLENADHMFKSIASVLASMSRPSVMCVYGDHVPIMPKVYELMGEPDGQTDYLIWRPDAAANADNAFSISNDSPGESAIAVNDLAALVLDAAGIRRPLCANTSD